MKYVKRVPLKVEPDEDYVLKHNLMPYIEKNFPSNSGKLIREIMEYRDKNFETLSSPYMHDYPKFPEANKDNLFKYIGVTREYVEELRQQVKNLPEWDAEWEANGRKGKKKTLYSRKANFTSEGTVMVLLMHYYYIHHQDKNIELLLRYLSYFQYFSTYLSQFGMYGVNPAVIDYTINSLPNSFILKRVGSVDGMLWHGTSGVYKAHPELIQVCDDVCIWYMLDLVKARMNSFMRNISSSYYKNHAKGNKIFSDGKEFNTEGEVVPTSSLAGNVKTLADSATSLFFTSQVSEKALRLISQQFHVSATEIKTAINKLKSDATVNEVNDFYNALFYLYLSNHPDGEDKIHTIHFAAAMDQIYKKGNSKNKNILLIKELSDKWLKAASKTYRASNREGTINNFRKSIYFYFVYVVVFNDEE